jgi:hypothetical protein
VLTNTYLGYHMGTIRVLRKATAQVELPLRPPLQALDKLRKLLEAIYEIASSGLTSATVLEGITSVPLVPSNF